MELLEIIIIAVIALIFLYIYLTWNFDYWEKQGVKHDKPWPLIGTLKPIWIKKLEDQDLCWYKKYGKIYGTFEGRNPVLNIADPMLLKTMFVKDAEVFLDKRESVVPATKNHFSKKFLPFMDKSEWLNCRRKISPTFSVKKMKPYISSVDNYSLAFKKILQKHSVEKTDVDLKTLLTRFNFNSLAAYGLGIQVDAMKHPEDPMFKSTGLLFNNMTMFGTYFSYLYPSVTKYITTMVHERSMSYLKQVVNNILKKKGQTDASQETSFNILDYLMQPEINLHPEAVSAHGIIYLTAYDFISMATALACYELACKFEYQERLIAEIDEQLTINNGELTYEVVRNMQYLDMVVKESLRKYPLLKRWERRCCKEGYQLNGITLKKGMMVTIPIWAIHHDEEFYPNPEVFDPERFKKDNSISSFIFLTFGLGPRNCVGLRLAILAIKLGLIHIFTDFRLRKSEQMEIQLQTVEFGITAMESMYFEVKERTDKPKFD